ncbi:class I SAM-dependent methyltransferase [Pyrobaculum neutrophilum]|uniref:Methyltransferase type 12 n=1 Tax=Pyrobaculum neutrophilum (strain DSM 2338 / JCM 9278 / NBRC 100436 / V24Sta) TaxID=444157 RepID=B1YBT5_PYRNV|nr:class I SAM-dependent methyltransferase [Pyrobaculum neutrophilum]ACB39319.1 Methyltransferase type 12 [Pyrobaculum neutrophilum V24Sta]
MDIDWAEVWAAWRREVRTPPDFWDRAAPRFYRSAKRRRVEVERFLDWLLGELGLGGGSSVLEVGAGAGAYAVPLAKRVSRVVAVEPSREMARYLRKYAEEEGVKVDVVEKRWEEVSLEEVGRHDLALAAHSLLVEDLRGAVEKLEEAARCVCVVLHVGVPGWAQLYRSLGVERPHRPWFTAFYNFLLQRGVYANVRIFERDVVREYPSVEEAAEDLGVEVERVVEALPRLGRRGDGGVVFKYKVKEAAVWWCRR